MKFTMFIIVSVLAIAIACAQDLRTAAAINGRIINGQDAKLGQFPYQALLRVQNIFGWNSLCGGTLIDKNWILTAAHCTQNARNATIALGTILLDIESAEQSFKVNRSNIINHPGYNGLALANDIALIYIPGAAITDLVKPISLPQNARDTYRNIAANATGWGPLIDSSTSASNKLQWGQMKIVNNWSCFLRYGIIITDSHLCVADKISTCVGDTGGPLVVESNNVLAGVILYANLAGCEMGGPIVFTKVNKYLNWITYIQNNFDSVTKLI